jgi:hypothetical protein
MSLPAPDDVVGRRGGRVRVEHSVRDMGFVVRLRVEKVAHELRVSYGDAGILQADSAAHLGKGCP